MRRHQKNVLTRARRLLAAADYAVHKTEAALARAEMNGNTLQARALSRQLAQLELAQKNALHRYAQIETRIAATP